MKDDEGAGYVLFIVTLASFLPAFVSSAINVALPAIGRDFSMDAVLLGWVVTSYLLAMAAFLVPVGRLADIHGRKRVFFWGMLLFTAFSLLCALSSSGALLISFRFLQGVGAAMVFSTAVAILTAVYPPGKRGWALGINVTAVYVALSLGPFLGGFLTQYLGWRSLFLINVPAGLIVMALIFWRLEGEWTEARGERFDVAGFLVYFSSLVALMYGYTLLPAPSGGAVMLLGLGGMVLFYRLESRSTAPIVNFRLFRENRVFALSNLAALINYSATFAVGFLLSLYLQYVKGFDAQGAGLILVAQPLVQALISPSAGKLSDRVEPRFVASAGMALTALGLLLMTLLDGSTGLFFVVGALVVIGVGLALFSSPNTNAVMSSVEKRHYGVASGMVATMRSLGMMLSMAIVMLVFSLVVGRVQIEPENYSLFIKSIRILFSIFVVLCIGGTLASLARGKMQRDRSSR
ncbi:MAG: MFS transporter [Methanosarcinales archaeon]|nr:MFS transporter [Methanosarcinales archaeon]